MSFSACALVRQALPIAAAGILALSAVPATAADSVDELVELNLRAWAGETELLAEVYAPDGVHTATFYDRTKEYAGPDGIEPVASWGDGVEAIGPRIDIPATDGEWRWASFASLGGGTACLFHAEDGQIVRHDCLLPETSDGQRAAVGLADAEASAAIDEVQERMNGSWARDTSVERLAEVYAPDAVHTARYLDTTMSYVGPEGIMTVARLGGDPTVIGERVDFEAPAGELAWAEVYEIAGGSVCLFRAVEGLVTRHDCVLPIRG